MKTLRRHNKITEQSGLATLEALPILIVFLVLITYGLGMFGAIHTSILYSISARTYAFETLRNRTNYVYFRDIDAGSGLPPQTLLHYKNIGFRLHGIDSTEEADSGKVVASTRPITYGRKTASKNESDADIHNSKIFQLGDGRNRQGGIEVNPIWVMVQYGICIDVRCGE